MHAAATRPATRPEFAASKETGTSARPPALPARRSYSGTLPSMPRRAPSRVEVRRTIQLCRASGCAARNARVAQLRAFRRTVFFRSVHVRTIRLCSQHVLGETPESAIFGLDRTRMSLLRSSRLRLLRQAPRAAPQGRRARHHTSRTLLRHSKSHRQDFDTRQSRPSVNLCTLGHRRARCTPPSQGPYPASSTP